MQKSKDKDNGNLVKAMTEAIEGRIALGMIANEDNPEVLLKRSEKLRNMGIKLLGVGPNPAPINKERREDYVMPSKIKDVKEKAVFIDKDWFLEEAKISINEASRFTGVTTRQIRYWTKKGFISSRSDDHYIYGFREVQKINLMTQFMARGLSMEEAAKKAERNLAEVEERKEDNSGKASLRRTWGGPTQEEIRREAKEAVKQLLEDPDLQQNFAEVLAKRISSDGKEKED